jgi:WD40 repeat protein
VAFSPDGRRLVTGGEDGSTRIWELDSGLMTVLSQDKGIVYTAKFDHDGSRVASGGVFGARIFSRDGAVVGGLSNSEVMDVAWKTDGSEVALAENGAVTLWDGATGRLLRTFPADGARVQALAFTPTGEAIVAGSVDGRAIGWNASTGERVVTLVGHRDAVNSLAVRGDGMEFATASSDGDAILWRPDGHIIAVLHAHSAAVLRAVFSPDGARALTSSDDGTARLWDAATGAPVALFAGHGGAVRDATFSPDGRWIATASADLSARIWDAGREEPMGAIRPTDERAPSHAVMQAVENLDLAAPWLNGSVPVAVSRSRIAIPSGTSLQLRDASNGRLVRELSTHGDHIRSVSFSPDGSLLAGGGIDETVRVWRADDGEPLAKLPLKEGAYRVAFSRSGRWLAAGSRDGRAHVWDSSSLAYRGAVAHDGEVFDVAFDSRDRWMATASDDGTVRVWELSDLKEVQRLLHRGKVWSVRFSSDGERIVTAGRDGAARIWLTRSGEPVGTLEGNSNLVVSAAFSDDGAFVASASFDGSVRIWDSRSLRVLIAFQHAGRAIDAWFSADNAHVVTLLQDGTVNVWDLPRDHRSPAEIHELVGCVVGLQLYDGLPRPTEPSCHSQR